ncbi:MAG: tetraacyldisaccharide 4'-kinase [Pricia sp.]
MSLLRKILYPFSLIYALVVYTRNYLYDIGIFESKTFKTPTICIGNLSVGGTGKTPMAELLISLLKDDHKVALLSRGYRRKSKGLVLADDTSSAVSLGDEPYQIFSKFPKVAVAVDADRRNGIEKLQNLVSPDVILLDDAFQHRKVDYGLSILLTAYGNLYCNDHYLPTGSLRDSKREAKRADLIVVTKCPQTLAREAQQLIIDQLKPQPHQQVLFSSLAYGPKVKGADLDFPLDDFKDKKLTLVTGIANPEPLVHYLKEKGLIFEHLRFKDHHAFSEKELSQLRQYENLLTTEKDYVRLKGKIERVCYLPIKHRFLGDGCEQLETCLEKFMKAYS